MSIHVEQPDADTLTFVLTVGADDGDADPFVAYLADWLWATHSQELDASVVLVTLMYIE